MNHRSLSRFLLGFFLLPVYLSSESGKELILSKVNDSIDGTVKISDLSIGWFRGIRLTDLSFADDGGFASVQVRKISTKPNYLALLGGNMAFADTVLDNPKVVITIKQDSLESKKTEAPSQPDSDGGGKQNEMAIALVALDLEINEGSAKINMTGDDNTIRTAAGFSLIWNSPMGPLRADFAKALTSENYDKTQFFHFGAAARF
jgi:hypothetical protein